MFGGEGLLRSLARYVRVLGVTKNLREAIRWLLLAEEKGYDDVPDTMNDITSSVYSRSCVRCCLEAVLDFWLAIEPILAS